MFRNGRAGDIVHIFALLLFLGGWCTVARLAAGREIEAGRRHMRSEETNEDQANYSDNDWLREPCVRMHRDCSADFADGAVFCADAHLFYE